MKLEDVRIIQRTTACGPDDLIYVAAGVAQTPPKRITGSEFLQSAVGGLPDEQTGMNMLWLDNGVVKVSPGLAATALLEPDGEDNDILLTSDILGAVGNALTAAIVIDDEDDRTGLSATKVGNDIVATSGDKRRMMITVAGTPMTLEPSGETAAGNDAVDWPVWTLGGVPLAEAENMEDPTYPFGYLRALFSGWEYHVATSSEDQVSGMPSNLPGWGPGDWPDVLVENFAAAPATAEQAIAAINAASLGVTATDGPDSDGSGVVDAVGPVQFSGGA